MYLVGNYLSPSYPKQATTFLRLNWTATLVIPSEISCCVCFKIRRLFSVKILEDIETLKGSTHQIILYDYRPINQRPIRFLVVVNAEVEAQCQELFEADIIEPSNSPWSSPVVPVTKKDGSLRLFIDYCRLNAVTVPDKHPVLNLSDAVFGLHWMK